VKELAQLDAVSEVVSVIRVEGIRT
jgi:hypothetical protein